MQNLSGFNNYVLLGHSTTCSGNTTTAAAAAQLELIPTPGAGLSIYVTDLVIITGSSIGACTFLNDATTTGAFAKMAIVANSVARHNFSEPFKLTANKPLGYTTSQDVLTVFASGFVAP